MVRGKWEGMPYLTKQKLKHWRELKGGDWWAHVASKEPTQLSRAQWKGIEISNQHHRTALKKKGGRSAQKSEEGDT